jgi:hypothetical protein
MESINSNSKKKVINNKKITEFFSSQPSSGLPTLSIDSPLNSSEMEIETDKIKAASSIHGPQRYESGNISPPCPQSTSERFKHMNEEQKISGTCETKTASSRKFKDEWRKTFFWVLHDNNTNTLFCSVCKSCQKEGVWVNRGAKKLHIDNLREHSESEKHHANLKFFINKERSLRITRYFPPITDEILYKLLELAHLVSTQDLPISFFSALCEKNKKLGMDLGSLYQNDDGFLELLRALSWSIEDTIVNSVVDSMWYGLLIDESTDISLDKNLIVYVRYYDDQSLTFCTKYLKLIALNSSDASSIFESLISLLNSLGLHTELLTGIATDGAAVMTGVQSGVCKKLKELNPYIVSCHCVAHRLNLASNNAYERIEALREYEVTAAEIINYVMVSPKRRSEFEALQISLNLKPLKLLREQETRWLSKYKTLKSIHHSYLALIIYFYKRGKEDNLTRQIYSALTSMDFLLTTSYLLDITGVLHRLCKIFQKQEVDYSVIQNSVSSSIEVLDSNYIKTSELWKPLIVQDALRKIEERHFRYEEVEIIFNEVDLIETYTKKIRPFVACTIEEIRARFPDSKILSSFAIFSVREYPKMETNKLRTFGSDSLIQLSAFYGRKKAHIADPSKFYLPLVSETGLLLEFNNFKVFSQTNFMGLEKEESDYLMGTTCKEQYPNLFKLFKIVGCIPVSTVDCERGFSRQNLIKTKLRNRLRHDHLDQLMRIAIEGMKVFDVHKRVCLQ